MKKWIVTFFGSGFSPIAPGTAGSFAMSLILFVLLRFVPMGVWTWNALLAVGVIVFSFLMVWLGAWAIREFKKKDPGCVVLDEAAGICLTMIAQPMTWVALVVGFFAFRIFDVIKPSPARELEKLPAGWGILMDDLAAAIYANLLTQVILRVVISGLS